MNNNPTQGALLTSFATAAAAVLMVGVTLTSVDDVIPNIPLGEGPPEGQEVVPVSQVQPLFARQTIASLAPSPDWKNPFFTTFFEPPPKPAPPTTESHAIEYKGLYQAADGALTAFILVDGTMAPKRVGDIVLADYALIAIQPKKVVMKQGDKTLEAVFNRSLTLKLPVK